MLTDQLFEKIRGVIESQLCEVALNSKEFLTFDECVQYTALSPNFLRQQVREGLSCYKLGGRRTFFKREEVDAWVLKNRVELGGEHE